MKIIFEVVCRDSEIHAWLHDEWFDTYEEAETYILSSCRHMQYKINKVWSWPF